jgi:hypothetical protein
MNKILFSLVLSLVACKGGSGSDTSTGPSDPRAEYFGTFSSDDGSMSVTLSPMQRIGNEEAYVATVRVPGCTATYFGWSITEDIPGTIDVAFLLLGDRTDSNSCDPRINLEGGEPTIVIDAKYMGGFIDGCYIVTISDDLPSEMFCRE